MLFYILDLSSCNFCCKYRFPTFVQNNCIDTYATKSYNISNNTALYPAKLESLDFIVFYFRWRCPWARPSWGERTSLAQGKDQRCVNHL